MPRPRFGKVQPVTGDIGDTQAKEKLESIVNNKNNENYQLAYCVDDLKTEGIIEKGKNQIVFSLEKEGKAPIKLMILKDSEIILEWKKNIYYVEPYQKQFLDKYDNNAVSTHFDYGMDDERRGGASRELRVLEFSRAPLLASP